VWRPGAQWDARAFTVAGWVYAGAVVAAILVWVAGHVARGVWGASPWVEAMFTAGQVLLGVALGLAGLIVVNGVAWLRAHWPPRDD
jgi:hypothetical protein